MNIIDMPAFYLGVKEELEKVSFDVSSMPVNENIIPTITNQAKWKYVRTKDGLKLSDGNLVYGFGGFPDEYPAEDTRVSRLDDDNILNFENDAVSKGTAQIHRASPDNIYVTLANGGQNPTFMLQHEEGKNWRYSPSKKFLAKLKAVKDQIEPISQKPLETAEVPGEDTTLIDPASLMKGAEDYIKEAYDFNSGFMGGSDRSAGIFNDILNKVQHFGNKAIDMSAAHPALSTLAGYGLAKSVSKLRDLRDPMREVERDSEPGGNILHEMNNLAVGAIPTMIAGAIRA